MGTVSYLTRLIAALTVAVAAAVIVLAVAMHSAGAPTVPPTQRVGRGIRVEPAVAASLPHHGLGRVEAADLVERVFPKALAKPAAAFTDTHVEHLLSAHAAIARSKGPDSHPVLVESLLPLATGGESGHKTPVNLALHQVGGHLEPVNSEVPLDIAGDLRGGVSLPGEGVKLELVGAPAVKPSVVGKSVAFYPNVAPDTDFAVSPTPTGFETFTQLRTASAPRSQRLALSLPAGAKLSATSNGGAEARSGDRPLLAVLPPTAVDAAGNDVPVTLDVSAGELRLAVIPGADAAYPILVDPQVETFAWQATESSVGMAYCNPVCDGEGWQGVAAGLWNWTERIDRSWHVDQYYPPRPLYYGEAGFYLRTADASGGTAHFHPGQGGYEEYHVPRWNSDQLNYGTTPSTYIESAVFSQLAYVGFSQVRSPVLKAGLWNESTGVYASLLSVGANELPLAWGETRLAEMDHQYEFFNHPSGSPVQAGVKTAKFGLAIEEEVPASVGRIAYLGNAVITLVDPDSPTVGTVEGPRKWVGATATEPIKLTASDLGLGVKRFILEPEKVSPAVSWTKEPVVCSGATKDFCPRTTTLEAVDDYNPSAMPEGIDWVKVTVEDPLGNKVSGKAEVRIDRTAPALTVGGTAVEQGTLGKKLASYTVKVTGQDGTAEKPQAGVAKSVIKVDGKVVDEYSPGCATQNCSLSREWMMESTKFTSGSHTVESTITDGAGNTTSKTSTVVLEPRPQITLSGSLAEQATVGVTLESYTLKAAVVGDPDPVGGAGTVKAEIEMDGSVVKTAEAACSAASCSVAAEWTVEAAAYLIGPHTVRVKATDGAKNLGTKVLQVSLNHDSQPPAISFSGTATQQALLGTGAASYTFNAFASDGSAAAPQSGVASMTISFDGTKVDESAPGCSTSNCTLSRSWTLTASKYLEGAHTFEVTATDARGHAKTETMVVTLQSHPKLALTGSMVEQGEATSRPKYDLEIQTSEVGQKPEFVSSFGTLGTGNGQFQSPSDIAISGSGLSERLWVADRAHSRLEWFTKTGTYGGQVGTFGIGSGQMLNPNAIAVGNGNEYVAESATMGGIPVVQVNVFNGAGAWQSKFGTYGSANGSFINPSGIAVSPAGNVFVVDTGNNRVVEFSKTGTFVRNIGGFGTTTGLFSTPRGIAIDSTGKLWVADSGNNRIESFTEEGKFVSSFGIKGSGEGQLNAPGAIDIDIAGNLIVGDTGNNRIERFTSTGIFIEKFGSAGTGAGQFSLTPPYGFATNSSNDIWVVDSGNNRVERWHTTPPANSLKLTVTVDGSNALSAETTCTSGNCSLTKPFTLSAATWGNGTHTVTIESKDNQTRISKKVLTVQVNADATDPALNVTGKLATAPHGWVEEGTYGLEATASDSGYGVTSLQFKIDGSVVASETQTCAVGGCGATLSKSVNTATFSPGAHEAEVIATDGAGNTTTHDWTMNVNPEGTVTASEAKDTLEAAEATNEEGIIASTEELISGGERAAGNNPEVVSGAEPGTLEGVGVPDPSVIDTKPEGGLTIETPEGNLEIAPTSTGASATTLSVANGSTAVAANTATNVDTVIRPIYDGTMIFQSIRNSSATEYYSWQVNLSATQSLHSFDTHNALVEYPDGSVAFSIAAGIAHDVTGKEVPTSLTVAGNVITLRVEHKGAAYTYPVTAGTGWQGGYETEIVLRPETEQERIEKEERKRKEEEELANQAAAARYMMENPVGYIHVDAPVPLPLGSENEPASGEEATASSVHNPARLNFEMDQCAPEVPWWASPLGSLLDGCDAYAEHMEGHFLANGTYVWWKNGTEPACSHSTGTGWSISQGDCLFVGQNHVKHGGGYHATARTLYNTGFLAAGEEEGHFTVYGYGSGYISGPHDSACICNPLP